MTDRSAIEAMIAANVARIRAGGTPDFLNRWLGMTPEQLAEIEAKRLRQAPHRDTARQWQERPMPIGPKEQTLRSMRQGKTAQTRIDQATAAARGGPPTVEFPRPEQSPAASAPVQPATAEAAQHQETDMKTARKTTKATKKAKSEAKGSARRKATTKGAARNTARGAASGGVRAGSKLEAIVSLLRRPEGCTSADVLAETSWPAVSLPQQAKAAGITLATEKEGRVTRYWDAATRPKAKTSA